MRMQVTRDICSLAILFAPYLALIKAKQGDEEYQAKAADAFVKWINGDTLEILERLCREGFELEENEGSSEQAAGL